MKKQTLDFVLYAQAARDAIVRGLALPGATPSEQRGAVYRLLAFAQRHGLSGNLWQAYLTRCILADENPWSLACESRGEQGGSLSRLAERDAQKFLELFSLRLEALNAAVAAEVLNFEPGREAVPTESGGKLTALRDELACAKDARRFACCMAEAYRRFGCGTFAFSRAFRADADGRLIPAGETESAALSDLVGYDLQKKQLIENTEAFLSGRESNNVLLYGDAGTGKSTCVRALLTEYADRPLRLVELQRANFNAIPALLSALRGRVYRFLIFIDDLSFEENETEYKYLKAAIEGGLETMPENVRIYATSNRRHLIRETWTDRNDRSYEDDLHHSDTVEEKLSLAGRFGVTIRFDSPDRQLFHEIVKTLLEKRGIAVGEDALLKAANAWEIRHGGLSGRTAQQFVDDLAGKSSAADPSDND